MQGNAGSLIHRIVLYAGVAIVFLAMIVMGAAPKLVPMLDSEEMRHMWTDIYGYPLWFRWVTGGLELVAAILVLVPFGRFWGALLTACIMIGAAITNAMAGLLDFLPVNAIIFVAAALVVWQSFRQWHGTQA